MYRMLLLTLRVGDKWKFSFLSSGLQRKNFFVNGAKYRLSDTESHVLLKEVILDRLEAKDSTISLPTVPGQSYPRFPGWIFCRD